VCSRSPLRLAALVGLFVSCGVPVGRKWLQQAIKLALVSFARQNLGGQVGIAVEGRAEDVVFNINLRST